MLCSFRCPLFDLSNYQIKYLPGGLTAPVRRLNARPLAHLAWTFVGYTRQELEAFRDATVPDLVIPPVKLLFVGINPGLWTAATQTHFAYPGNRFYPALLKAGIIDWPIDPSAGMTDDDRRRFTERGLGISNVAPRATAKASELSNEELRQGAERLAASIKLWRPAVVAIAGITAYRTGFKKPKAVMGRQSEMIGEAELWVLPNPSGLNAHESVDSLAGWYRQAADAAGVTERGIG